MKRYRHYTKDKAIILSCFGSIVESEKYFDLKRYVEKEFEGIDVFLSFNSRMVIKLSAKKGMNFKNLPQVLSDVDMQGYKKIIIASINLFPTDEHKMIKKTAKGFSCFSLANIRVSKAVFTKSKETTNFLISLNKKISQKDTANLFIIHGTPLLDIEGSNSISYIENLLPKLNPMNFTCSLEGSNPFFALKDYLKEQFRKKGVKKVQIVPMLLVSGNHFVKDMVEIKEELSDEFETFIAPSLTKSDKFNLIQMQEIKDIIVSNIKEEIKKLGE